VVVGKNGGVIPRAYSLPENDYDGHALKPTLEQVEPVAGSRPEVAIGDKGFIFQKKCQDAQCPLPA
jgi:hypothetical protein